MIATHANSKTEQNFQNRTPWELNQSFDIFRISMKKVMRIPNLGIQPNL